MVNLSKTLSLPSFPKQSDRLIFLLLAGSVSIGLVSIAVSQILLAATIFGAVWTLDRRKLSHIVRLPLIPPALALFLWTLVSVLVSSNVLEGLVTLKKIFIFSILILVPLIAQSEGALDWIYRAIFAVAAISSLTGLVQYAIDPNRDLSHRISGFMSQWMTYSGLLMLVLILLCAFTLSAGWRKQKWVIPLGIIFIVVLILSETRNAWIGATLGIFVIIVLMRPRAVPILLTVLLVIYLISPPKVKQRLQSGFDPEDPNTRNRIELFETSFRLIKANPWFGVGVQNVNQEALKYRGRNEYPDWMYQHMHNNFLQIAAERGIPGLLIWLWFMGRLAWDALHVYRKARKGIGSNRMRAAVLASAAAMGTWVGLMAAGMLEYNFGDSEVLALFFFIVSSSYVFVTRTDNVANATDPANLT
jgi:O-antigen ligase